MDVPPYYRNGYKMMAITHLMEDLEDIENWVSNWWQIMTKQTTC